MFPRGFGVLWQLGHGLFRFIAPRSLARNRLELVSEHQGQMPSDDLSLRGADRAGIVIELKKALKPKTKIAALHRQPSLSGRKRLSSVTIARGSLLPWLFLQVA
jgi:hypothetical protein